MLKKLLKWGLGIFVVLIVIALLVPTPDAPAGSGRGREPAAASTTPAVQVTASEILAAYEANGLAAKETYEGKDLRISGTVDSVGDDITGTPYVALATGKTLSGLNVVQCMLERDQVSRASGLKAGDQVTLDGRGAGYIVNVIVRGCRFVE